MREVTINQEPIELYKLLKFEGHCMSGAEAKNVVAEGLVTLNGAVETQKRKKVVSGDEITFADVTLKVKLVVDA